MKARLREVEERLSDLVLTKQKQIVHEIKWERKTESQKLLFSLEEENCFLTNQSRIGIIGKNGSGKTFFLKQLKREMERLGVSYYYLPQEFSIAERVELQNQLEALSSDRCAKVMSLVNGMGSEPVAIKNSKHLSAGESKKIHLAMGADKMYDILLLDEPTNDLDIYANESLLRSLLSYTGAVVFISHEDRFLKIIAKETWELENFTVRKKQMDKNTV